MRIDHENGSTAQCAAVRRCSIKSAVRSLDYGVRVGSVGAIEEVDGIGHPAAKAIALESHDQTVSVMGIEVQPAVRRWQIQESIARQKSCVRGRVSVPPIELENLSQERAARRVWKDFNQTAEERVVFPC